uniref:RING-type E3 ubiquitin transferase n=1 Tax=Euplotes harpa TaxID=151035 RepID=A0A7S3N8V9_9SPIT|mmetsp:Transcript_1925/g.2408  ORF Transcript_1925/g.2408 Transcript_1925/m.2408 type:complete len:115 (+) Transcript_1925:315-659(+)
MQMKISDSSEKLALQSKIQEANTRFLNYKTTVQLFFAELEKVYTCPIKYDKIVDPVITPSGVTYERVMIERSIKVNRVDPVSKDRLTIAKIKPNLAIKCLIHVVNEYRKKLETA